MERNADMPIDGHRPHATLLLLAMMASAAPYPGTAQTPAPGPVVAPLTSGATLIVNPQLGAPPKLAPPSAELPPAYRLREPTVSSPTSRPGIEPFIDSVQPVHDTPPAVPVGWEAIPRAQRDGLPAPSDDPMQIDEAADPVLMLTRSEVPAASFHAAIAAAVLRAPSLEESIAQREEATGVRNEAVTRGVPVADLSLSSFRVISRAFSDDPDNILERSRPANRTDGTIHIQQPIIDFGATGQRIAAGNEREQAAAAGIEDIGSQIALQAIGSWYNVFGYRALVRIGTAFARNQHDLRRDIEDRVRQGVTAPGDVAQVDSYIASADAQLADFKRSLANAEAQYLAIMGTPAPSSLGRAPVPALGGIAAPALAADAAKLPTVRAARNAANAAGRDVKALYADRLPQFTGAIDAGRYGVVENKRDYDLRGTVSVTMRIGGGAAQRIEQAKARVDGAEAHFRRTRDEATRDASIALSDVAALEEARTAIAGNYIASRRSRDVLAARFRVSHGTIFDLMSAESNYFGIAARYIQTVIELDTARYVLLARTGRLLTTLGIDAASLDPRERRSGMPAKDLP